MSAPNGQSEETSPFQMVVRNTVEIPYAVLALPWIALTIWWIVLLIKCRQSATRLHKVLTIYPASRALFCILAASTLTTALNGDQHLLTLPFLGVALFEVFSMFVLLLCSVGYGLRPNALKTGACVSPRGVLTFGLPVAIGLLLVVFVSMVQTWHPASAFLASPVVVLLFVVFVAYLVTLTAQASSTASDFEREQYPAARAGSSAVWDVPFSIRKSAALNLRKAIQIHVGSWMAVAVFIPLIFVVAYFLSFYATYARYTSQNQPDYNGPGDGGRLTTNGGCPDASEHRNTGYLCNFGQDTCNLRAQAPVTGLDECCTLCKRQAGCSAFTYERNGSICQLWNNDGHLGPLYQSESKTTYILPRLAAIGTTVRADTGCGTCETLGYGCGEAQDACGNNIYCGVCDDLSLCDDFSHQCNCGSPCVEYDIACGTVTDNCGHRISCGICEGNTAIPMALYFGSLATVVLVIVLNEAIVFGVFAAIVVPLRLRTSYAAVFDDASAMLMSEVDADAPDQAAFSANKL